MSGAVTDTQLYEFLWTWINTILNVDAVPIPNPLIVIIPSEEDSPPPTTNYITINITFNRRKIGRMTAGDVQSDDTPGGGADDFRTQVNDYEYLVELRQSVGYGNLLQTLIDSIELNNIKDLFSTNNVTYYGQENIQSIPQVKGQRWRKEAVVELRLGVATGSKEKVPYIETVEYTANLSNP